MHVNLGSEINKLLKIFLNKKTNFYVSKWGFSALKIPKIQELQGDFCPLDPPTGTLSPVPHQGPVAPWNPGLFMV